MAPSPSPKRVITAAEVQYLGQDADVVIKIYEQLGKLIRNIDLGRKEAGYYTKKSAAVYWDGRNDSGELVASGVYFYSIKAGEFTATKKLLILK
ncbi:T9SS type A sorting domain-containing protein [Candidatus Poribacteria bacterium]|nr:T9SS type A sorting domain-containing protein [Candidatus Poribacteria bacterium]